MLDKTAEEARIHIVYIKLPEGIPDDLFFGETKKRNIKLICSCLGDHVKNLVYKNDNINPDFVKRKE